MLRLINFTGEKFPLTEYRDLSIESVLSHGDKELSFTIPIAYSENIKEECYIQTESDEFVIKELDISSDEIKVKASLNIEELDGTFLDRFDSTEHTIVECMNLALVGTNWTVTSTITKYRTITMTDCTPWDVIKQVIKTYAVELEIDSLNKVLDFTDHIGSDKGVYFTDQLNLTSLSISSDTHEYYTRLIPIGKDGLTIESVNSGKNYVENHQYSNKIRTLRWKDERYTAAQSLKDDAELKLADLSKPYRAYSCDIIDLAKSGNHGILEFSIGDTVTIMDSRTGTKEKQRIVKITEYPDDYSKNTCELSNVIMSFEEMASAYEDTVSTVNNITVDNGTVDGSTVDGISTSQIYDFDSAVIGNATVTQLQADYATISGTLTAVQATVGTLESTMVTTAYADLHYADIDLANVAAGSIGTALIADAAIGTTQIADGSITDAKIVELTANKLTAGTIDASEIDVINLNCDNLTVGTINGAQIAPGAIDMTNLTTSLGNAITTAQSDASVALSTANDRNRVFYQTTPPAGTDYIVNDLWFDTDDGNKIYTWDGSTWTAVEFGTSAIAAGAITADEIATEVNNAISAAQTNAAIALTDAGTALSTANTANQAAASAQSAASTAQTTATNAQNAATNAATAASTAQTKADDAKTVADAASQAATNAQSAADDANQAALDAAGIANGKGKVIIQSTAPDIADHLIQNLWIDTTNNANTPKRWNGTAWVAVTDKAATDAASAAATAQTNASTALTNAAAAQNTADAAQTAANTAKTTADNATGAASTAQSAADAAQSAADVAQAAADDAQATATTASIAAGNALTTANGKNKIIFSTAAASGTAYAAGDIWFQKVGAVITAQWEFVSGAWASRTLDNAVIANLNAGKITAGYLDVARLQAGTITASKLVAGTITAESGILANAVITEAKIADLAVTGAKIANATIGEAKIANLAVTGAKIAVGTIENANIKDATIDTAKIANINAGKINAGTLSVSRLEIVGTTNSIVYALNNAGNLTSTVTTSLNGDLLTERTITADKIVAHAITANEIASKTITANEIAVNTITATEMNVTSLSAITANLGTVTAGIIRSNGYSSGGSGMLLNLDTGVIDTKYFKVASNGSLSITGGTINISASGSTTNIIQMSSSLTSGSSTYAYTTLYRPSILQIEAHLTSTSTPELNRISRATLSGGVLTLSRIPDSTGTVSNEMTISTTGIDLSYGGTSIFNVTGWSNNTATLGIKGDITLNGGLTISSASNGTEIIKMQSTDTKSSMQFHNTGSIYWAIGLGLTADAQNFGFYNTNSGANAHIQWDGVFVAPGFTSTSTKDLKTNIIAFDGSALDIVSRGTVYNYNLKASLSRGDKVHYGFIIGDGYTIADEVVNFDGNAIDLYSVCGITWKAMQELNTEIENLKSQLQSACAIINNLRAQY